ncbi:glycoside hydrolase superfamily [Lipomyces oligophaga]|uniref:glycoside hydrolase superfamily n=1 Tax=Lipomyces oligophaga TaxID=45792 RepID=UPI0034CE52F9
MSVSSVTLNPPLRTSTAIRSRVVRIRAFIESTDLPSEFQIELWWSTDVDSESWYNTAFQQRQDTANPLLLTTPVSSDESGVADGTISTVYEFELCLVPPKLAHHLEYTARYRLTKDDNWVWLGKPNTNGKIILYSRSTTCQELQLPDLFSDFNSSLQSTKMLSEAVGADVWRVSGSVESSLEQSTIVPLGIPSEMTQFLALVRIQRSWMGPYHGHSNLKFDRTAFLILYERKDGKHVAVIPMSNIKANLVSYLQAQNGSIMFNLENTSGSSVDYSVFIAASDSSIVAVQAAFYSMRSTARAFHQPLKGLTDSVAHKPFNELDYRPEVQPVVKYRTRDHPPVSGLWYEEWLDCMGFCTWNSLGVDVSHDSLLQALQSLHDNNVRVGLVIIDDGWQSVDSNRRLERMEANSKFPGGLKHTVDAIKRRFPYIRHVAVWHALLGYWQGMSPNGDIAHQYKLEHGMLYNYDAWLVSGDDIDRYYDDYYKFLAQSGISVVKVDVQMHIYDIQGDHIRSSNIYQKYQDALKISALRYLNLRVIYCMAMSTQYFDYALIETGSSKPLLRNSDDFFPNIPDSHHWHVYCNALNNLFTGLLNVIPDWDMFMSTVAPYAVQHAVARCISGSAVYITDTPGFHDMVILNQIHAETIRGSAVSLRPSRVAQAIDPYFDMWDNRLMFVSNFYGATGGFSLLAAFNVSQEKNAEFTEPVKPSMMTGLVDGAEYVLRSYMTGATQEFQFHAATGREDNDPVLMLTKLKSTECDIFTAAPLATIKTHYSNRVLKVGALGLVDKYTGAAAIARQQVIVPVSGRAILDVDLKVLGILSVYISDAGPDTSGAQAERSGESTVGELGNEELAVPIAKMLITIQGEVMPISALSSTGKVLLIDVEYAWKELQLKSRYSNEVAIRIYLS